MIDHTGTECYRIHVVLKQTGRLLLRKPNSSSRFRSQTASVAAALAATVSASQEESAGEDWSFEEKEIR